MAQSFDEIVADLRSYVGGRGRKDNFMFDKVYSPSSGIYSVDFSKWIGKCLVTQDVLSLAVFHALGSEETSFSIATNLQVSDDGEIEISDPEDVEGKKKDSLSFKREVNRHKKEIQYILDFPFERYFVNEIGSAKIELLIAWLLGYKEKPFSRVMMAHRLEFKNASTFMKRYNDRKKKQFELPSPLPTNIKFQEFQKEFGKLPFATRLHLFDVLEYSGYGGRQASKPLSEKTVYDTRASGIDVNESAEILRQSRLITSFSDGGGVIASEYIEPISIALDYAKKLEPVYYEWKNEVAELISDKTSVYFYNYDDPEGEGYFVTDEDEE